MKPIKFTEFLSKIKYYSLKGFTYGKIIGIIWLTSFIILSPLVFILGGWKLLVAYWICKVSGFCPL